MQNIFRLTESTAFFSFLRLVITSIDPEDGMVSARLLPSVNQSGDWSVPDQKSYFTNDGCFAIEAMINRARFPDDYDVEILSKRSLCTMRCKDLIEEERREHARSSLDDLFRYVEAWRLKNPGATPNVLDIGGRARSGSLLADQFRDCNVTVLDIVADAGVDVVTDIHEMSDRLDHEAYDFLICVSVFEHLVMPWKAVIEINKVLAPDAIAFIQTHQTVGLHDMPWDYFRFSDQSWKGLFNTASGFKILDTNMANFVRITPMRYFNIEPNGENAGGFYESSVVVQKTGPTVLEWPVRPASIVQSSYPA